MKESRTRGSILKDWDNRDINNDGWFREDVDNNVVLMFSLSFYVFFLLINICFSVAGLLHRY
jgi:hypothetical protein